MSSLLRHIWRYDDVPANQNRESETCDRLLQDWGCRGHGNGQFNMPCGVCVTKTGN